MRDIDKKTILDFAMGEITLNQLFEKLPYYAKDENLLEQYFLALETKNKDLLSYIRLIPVLEMTKFQDIFRQLILENWHIENEDIVGQFQSTFNNDYHNIKFLLQAIDIVPNYLKFDDMKYPYIRKIIYAIGAQPEPYNIETLEKIANETEDEQIKELALHQIKKRKEFGRWEFAENIK